MDKLENFYKILNLNYDFTEEDLGLAISNRITDIKRRLDGDESAIALEIDKTLDIFNILSVPKKRIIYDENLAKQIEQELKVKEDLLTQPVKLEYKEVIRQTGKPLTFSTKMVFNENNYYQKLGLPSCSSNQELLDAIKEQLKAVSNIKDGTKKSDELLDMYNTFSDDDRRKKYNEQLVSREKAEQSYKIGFDDQLSTFLNNNPNIKITSINPNIHKFGFGIIGILGNLVERIQKEPPSKEKGGEKK